MRGRVGHLVRLLNDTATLQIAVPATATARDICIAAIAILQQQPYANAEKHSRMEAAASVIAAKQQPWQQP